MKPISEDAVEIKVTISKETFQKLKRIESLLAQRQKPHAWGFLLEEALTQYIEKHDPVKKAERAHERKLRAATVELSPLGDVCPGRDRTIATQVEKKRVPVTAEQKHAVFLRDQGMCTFEGLNGKRCGSDRWIDVHHKIPVWQGGTNDIDNLTTLCSSHHDLVHQLSLPIEGQVTWLRSPRVRYG